MPQLLAFQAHAPGVIRTHNLLIRSQILYHLERRHAGNGIGRTYVQPEDRILLGSKGSGRRIQRPFCWQRLSSIANRVLNRFVIYDPVGTRPHLPLSDADGIQWKSADVFRSAFL
jgi:hypothetical protein